MESYHEMKEHQQKEFNAFPLAFAFNEDQFEQGMNRLGLDVSETDKVYGIGAGGFMRKSDSEAFHEMLDRLHKETHDAFMNNGQEWAEKAFYYELTNHEYCITLDTEPALYDCGFSLDEVKAVPHLWKALRRAMNEAAKCE